MGGSAAIKAGATPAFLFFGRYGTKKEFLRHNIDKQRRQIPADGRAAGQERGCFCQ
jgi:hypothetical protein